MVTPHFQSIKQTTHKQTFMFTHIKLKQRNAIRGREKKSY